MVSFSEDFRWYGKEFQTFGPKYLKLFVPNLTGFDFGISRFSLYFSRVKRFVILSLKMPFMKLGLISFRVLKISIHKLQKLETLMVLYSDFFNNSSYELL